MNIWVQQIIQVIISGIVTASVYAILGIGLSIIYGIARIFNFAYGSFFTWGRILHGLCSQCAHADHRWDGHIPGNLSGRFYYLFFELAPNPFRKLPFSYFWSNRRGGNKIHA